MIVLATPSQILYHVTSVEKADSILRTDEFRLNPGEVNSTEYEHAGANWYFSTARSLTSTYIRQKADWGSAILVLDGVKLGHRYKSVAVNYWHRENFYSSNAPYEAEDRILSKKPEIPNAVSYIKEVHVMPSSYSKGVQSLYIQCKRRKIPIFFYEEHDPYMLLQKNKADTRPTEAKPSASFPSEKHEDLRNIIALWKIPRDSNRLKWRATLRYTLDLLRADQIHPHTVESYLKQSLQYDRPAAVEFVSLIRHNKMTISEFLKRLKEKWQWRSCT